MLVPCLMKALHCRRSWCRPCNWATRRVNRGKTLVLSRCSTRRKLKRQKNEQKKTVGTPSCAVVGAKTVALKQLRPFGRACQLNSNVDGNMATNTLWQLAAIAKQQLASKHAPTRQLSSRPAAVGHPTTVSYLPHPGTHQPHLQQQQQQQQRTPATGSSPFFLSAVANIASLSTRAASPPALHQAFYGSTLPTQRIAQSHPVQQKSNLPQSSFAPYSPTQLQTPAPELSSRSQDAALRPTPPKSRKRKSIARSSGKSRSRPRTPTGTSSRADDAEAAERKRRRASQHSNKTSPENNKGKWTEEEDAYLRKLVTQFGDVHHWTRISELMPQRNTKQCRERWCKHLDYSLKHGGWTTEEDAAILNLRAAGKGWAEISRLLEGRTDNTVKIRWNSLVRMQRRLAKRAAKEEQLRLKKQSRGRGSRGAATSAASQRFAAKQKQLAELKLKQAQLRDSQLAAAEAAAAKAKANSKSAGRIQAARSREKQSPPAPLVTTTSASTPGPWSAPVPAEARIHKGLRPLDFSPLDGLQNTAHNVSPSKSEQDCNSAVVTPSPDAVTDVGKLNSSPTGENIKPSLRDVLEQQFGPEAAKVAAEAVEAVLSSKSVSPSPRPLPRSSKKSSLALRRASPTIGYNNKGKWLPEEDAKLMQLVTEVGQEWAFIAASIDGRNVKQCRERWCKHLDPSLRHGQWSAEEDEIILTARQDQKGWAEIARMLNGRTDNKVKIRWNSLVRARDRSARIAAAKLRVRWANKQAGSQKKTSPISAAQHRLTSPKSVLSGATTH